MNGFVTNCLNASHLALLPSSQVRSQKYYVHTNTTISNVKISSGLKTKLRVKSSFGLNRRIGRKLWLKSKVTIWNGVLSKPFKKRQDLANLNLRYRLMRKKK